MLQEQSSGMTWTILSTEPYQQIEQGFLQWLRKKEVGKQRTFAFFCRRLVVKTFRSIACAKELCQPLEGCQHLKPSQISTICTMHLPVTPNHCPYTKLLSSLLLTPSMHISLPVELAPKHLTSEKRNTIQPNPEDHLLLVTTSLHSPLNCRENFQVSHVVSP